MSTPPKTGLEAISVKRASIADANKVRYRVYSGPNEFTTVIAESALMAVKVSGIKAPYKIMRDLPGEGGKVESGKLEQNGNLVALDPVSQKTAKEEMARYITELSDQAAANSVLFVPMGIGDLRNKNMTRARILSAEMLQEIIEEHAKHQPIEEPLAAPVEMPAVELNRPPEPSQAEKLAQLAEEVLPASEPLPPAEGGPELSPEEVKKLLDE